MSGAASALSPSAAGLFHVGHSKTKTMELAAAKTPHQTTPSIASLRVSRSIASQARASSSPSSGIFRVLLSWAAGQEPYSGETPEAMPPTGLDPAREGLPGRYDGRLCTP